MQTVFPPLVCASMGCKLLVSIVFFAGIGCGADVSDPGKNIDAGTFTSDGESVTAVVYGQTADTLYSVNPDTFAIQVVGDFNTSDAINDIAVSATGDMYGVSDSELFRVDTNTGSATFVSPLADSEFFNGLSFIPDPNDPNREILVGVAQNGTVWRLDTQTGSEQYLGTYGNGYQSSGDLVFVKDFGLVATIRGDGNTDVLARINPTTFSATAIGPIGYRSLYGVGFWYDKVYGFSSGGELVLIDPTTGAGVLQEDNDLRWYGAGVTTEAVVTID